MKQKREGVKEVVLGVAKSLKQGDNRVAIAPHKIHSLKPAAWNNGREKTELKVLVEKGAGEGAGYSDSEYIKAGAEIVNLKNLLVRSNILVDVKQRPKDGLLQNGVNVFYAHMEKGQGPEQLGAVLEAENVNVYSPETFWLREKEGVGLVRGTNLGYFAGMGGVHLLFEGIKLSYQARNKKSVPFGFFPKVEGATADEIKDSYKKVGELEKSIKFTIIGGKNGLASSGAQHEFDKAGVHYDFIYRDVTSDEAKFAKKIAEYDGLINATVWNPGDSRIITKKQISSMRKGAVLIDVTCDQDRSSTVEDEGDPVIGGVRYSYETKWGDSNTFYWVGSEEHKFNDTDPLKFEQGKTRVLYNTNGMVPAGTSTAAVASDAYFNMIFPYLTNIIRAVSQGTKLPDNGLVVKDGRIHHSELREVIQSRKDLDKFRRYL